MKNTPIYTDSYTDNIRKKRKYQQGFEYGVIFTACIFALIFFGNLWVVTGVGKSPLTPSLVILFLGFMFGLGKVRTGKRLDDFRVKTYTRLVNLYVNICDMPDSDSTRKTAQNTIKEHGEDEIYDWLNSLDAIERQHGREALLSYLQGK